MKKRILSILLLCCMVLTLLPTAAFAAGEIDEQFTLAPGGTYYFDLSAMGIPGTVNDALPDKTMRYVPFTYAGTVDSYKLTSFLSSILSHSLLWGVPCSESPEPVLSLPADGARSI